MTKNEILLPPGKKPFVMSQDDVSYYGYMTSDGFATRMIIDENGNPSAHNEEKYQMTLDYLGRKPSVDSEHYQKWFDRWPILYNYTYDIANVGKFDCLFTTVNEIKNNTYINMKVEKSDIYEEFAIDEGNASYGLYH